LSLEVEGFRITGGDSPVAVGVCIGRGIVVDVGIDVILVSLGEGDVEVVCGSNRDSQLVLSGVSSRDDEVVCGHVVSTDDISKVDQVILTVPSSLVSAADGVVDGDVSSEVALDGGIEVDVISSSGGGEAVQRGDEFSVGGCGAIVVAFGIVGRRESHGGSSNDSIITSC